MERDLASDLDFEALSAETDATQRKATASHHLLVANHMLDQTVEGGKDLRAQLRALLLPIKARVSAYLPSAHIDETGTYVANADNAEGGASPLSEAARALNQALSLLDSGSNNLDRTALLKNLTIVFRMAGNALRTPDVSAADMEVASLLRAAAERAVKLVNAS